MRYYSMDQKFPSEVNSPMFFAKLVRSLNCSGAEGNKSAKRMAEEYVVKLQQFPKVFYKEYVVARKKLLVSFKNIKW